MYIHIVSMLAAEVKQLLAWRMPSLG